MGNNFRRDLENDDKKTRLNKIGVAICNPKDNMVFEVMKPLIRNVINKTTTKAKALIKGLNVLFFWG